MQLEKEEKTMKNDDKEIAAKCLLVDDIEAKILEKIKF